MLLICVVGSRGLIKGSLPSLYPPDKLRTSLQLHKPYFWPEFIRTARKISDLDACETTRKSESLGKISRMEEEDCDFLCVCRWRRNIVVDNGAEETTLAASIPLSPPFCLQFIVLLRLFQRDKRPHQRRRHCRCVVCVSTKT